jgi:hypothetical protein
VRAVATLHCYVLSWGEQIGPVLALTENISRKDVLLHWMAGHENLPKPKVMDPISLAIELPAALGATEQRFIRCEGRVVRVSHAQALGAFRIAVSIQEMWFSDRKDGFARSFPMATVAEPEFAPTYPAQPV